MWLQMGGHCEPEDATLAGAALREGDGGVGHRRADACCAGGRCGWTGTSTPCAWHLDVQYAARGPAGAVEEISDESLDLRWFAYDEVAERGGRLGRTPAGQAPARCCDRHARADGTSAVAPYVGRPERSAPDVALVLRRARPAAPMPYWAARPAADLGVLRRQQLAGLDQRVALPMKLSSQPSPVLPRRRQTPEECVCACICTRSPVDQATTASASQLTYLSGVTCIISGVPEVIRATLPRPVMLSWYLPEPEIAVLAVDGDDLVVQRRSPCAST